MIPKLPITGNDGRGVNPNGVDGLQPRVGESSSLPWVNASPDDSTLKGLRPSENFRRAASTLSGLMNVFAPQSQGSPAKRGQPWAGGRNPFGVLKISFRVFLCLVAVLPASALTNDPKAEYAVGRADAARDIGKGLIRYEIVGQPMMRDEELKKIAQERYGITVELHGCMSGPRAD